MEAKIQKWGNSLCIRIPMHIINDLSLKNGSTVDITEMTDTIIISATNYNQKTSLCIACLIISKIKGYPFEVIVEENNISGAILVDQI